MTSTPLDSLLATAQEYNASDLHIIAGVPPAFRVNGGEIVLAETATRTFALTPTLSPREPRERETFRRSFGDHVSVILLSAANGAPPGGRVGVRASLLQLNRSKTHQ